MMMQSNHSDWLALRHFILFYFFEIQIALLQCTPGTPAAISRVSHFQTFAGKLECPFVLERLQFARDKFSSQGKLCYPLINPNKFLKTMASKQIWKSTDWVALLKAKILMSIVSSNVSAKVFHFTHFCVHFQNRNHLGGIDVVGVSYAFQCFVAL